jgi:DNA-binding CsgD family transcriptional regulator
VVGAGWLGEGALAVERLLTPENAEHHTEAWLHAVFASQDVVLGAFEDSRVWHDLTVRAEQVAGAHGDSFRLAIARYFTGDVEETRTLREQAQQRGDLYWQALAAVDLASHIVEDDPSAAKPLLADADTLAQATGSRSLRDEMVLIRARAARTEGDLRGCIELGLRLLETRGLSRPELLHIVSFAALLAMDEGALRAVAEKGRRLERDAPGFAVLVFNATHRLGLFEGQPSAVDPEFQKRRHYWGASFGTLWLICREAIDAGEAQVALTQASALTRPVPHGRAVLAAIQAAVTGDEDRWHDALALALDHDLRLIAVDALEGLSVAASRAEGWAECLRLLSAADRLRNETGYRWRFTFEQSALDAAQTAASDALSDTAAAAANGEGYDLDWRAAASYARRARGERQRPHHGWDSLTPTEGQVAALVAKGLTNPQIAQRLFIARSTVKTHLDHIFNKTGVRTRAELAAEATRRGDTRR